MNEGQNIESMDKNTSSKYQRRNRNMNRNMDMDRNMDMNMNMDIDMNMEKHMHMDDKFPIGMAYVPWQRWGSLYEPEKALKVGTIFPELNKPYYGKRGDCPW